MITRKRVAVLPNITTAADDNDGPNGEVDAIINDDGTVLLRAERDGKGDGRVYTISYTITDIEGTISGSVQVIVPHSRKSDTAVDSGGTFDSCVAIAKKKINRRGSLRAI
jgi:hypothetical protein